MLTRDRLLARLKAMGERPDYPALAREILGIRGAPPELARRLVAQALVVEDRSEHWRRTGARVSAAAPSSPGVYVLRDAEGAALYVGKANDLRRRLRTHFAGRRWKAMRPEFARVADAEWREVGSELEALVREAQLIDELRPAANVQVAAPRLKTRAIPAALVRDVIVVVPSIESDSAELVAARADGPVVIQRTRRSGEDLAVHASRLRVFFGRGEAKRSGVPLAPVVFSWLAGRGRRATRLDPHDAPRPADLRRRLAALLADDRLFEERIVVV